MDQFEIVPAGVRDPAPYVVQDADGPGGGGEIDTVAALKRRKGLIALVVAGVALLAFLVTRLMTPLYEAEAGIMFKPHELTPMGTPTQIGTMLPSEETARKNEIAVIRSRELADAVVTRLQLDQLPEFNPALRPPSQIDHLLDTARTTIASWAERLPDEIAAPIAALTLKQPENWTPDRIRNEVIERFQRRLETSSADASRVVGIRFYSEDAQRSTLVANTIAETFIDRKRARDLAGAEALVANLTQEIGTLNHDIQDSERKVDERKLSLGLSANGTRALEERLAELSRQLMGATAERVRAEAQFAEAQQVRNSGDLQAAAQVLGSSLIQRLQEAQAMATARAGQLALRYQENHPQMQAARQELRDIRAKLGEEMNKIQTARLNAVAIGKATEAGLHRQVDELKAQMTKANAAQVDVGIMEREVEAKRALMPQLTARLNSVNAQIDYMKNRGADTEVLSQAVVPRRASYPPTLAIMATAVIMAAGGGGILAVMLERADNTIQSTSQLRRMTPLRVIGTLPVVRRRRRRGPPAAEVLNGGDTSFQEHLRTIALRSGVCGPASAKVMLITSAVSGEGKSSTASSLARMLSLSGRRTIIVDADLRAPVLHRIFGLQRGPGLAECIEEGLGLEEVIQRDEATGTHVIAAGQARGASSDVLQSRRMQDLVGELALHYDNVIIDSPPVLAVYDSNILARLVDRTLMIVRWRSTHSSTLATALQRLSDDNVPVDGIVLSQVDGRKYSVYGYPDSEVFSPGFRKYYQN
ncbi:GumC family protein [Azospirillum canadense]|uniref:GumC family protein n=1 Tax=Azospirillum canadense TaxID=403962 RepID=UPI0022268ED1|nr:polysaccharide biosynthesis tyrosine autokinase [Azospirillum canadense]MCW2238634.1 capsular exopolysaccharide synthesis family protein [Azospirillum canadense]